MSERTAADYTDSEHVANLVTLVARLVRQVRKHDHENDVAEKALGYLKRAELDQSILRGIMAGRGKCE